MSVPTSYLTSLKNVKAILQSIQRAQAPKRFTTRFLASLGFPNVNDRLIIGVLKSVGFLTAEGQPTKRYFEYLDSSQSKRMLAEGIREAYADLFQINRNANEMSASDVKNKLRTLSQGQVGDSVVDKMAATFKALTQQADFTATTTSPPTTRPKRDIDVTLPPPSKEGTQRAALGGLVYNIQIILPADRDQAVYDALFRSLKEHLLQ